MDRRVEAAHAEFDGFFLQHLLRIVKAERTPPINEIYCRLIPSLIDFAKLPETDASSGAVKVIQECLFHRLPTMDCVRLKPRVPIEGYS